MILLASGSAPVKRFGGEPWLGQLLCPRSRNKIVLPRWAADNAAFSKFDASAYMRMLERIVTEPTRPLFVAVPDHVGDACRTRWAFAEWSAVLAPLKLPLAYVLQDGQVEATVPWDLIVAVFVGGTTAFKVGPEARALVAAAQRRGKWVHMGRLSTHRRMVYAQQIGVDSIDGSGFARWADEMIPRFTRVNDHPTLALSTPQEGVTP